MCLYVPVALRVCISLLIPPANESILNENISQLVVSSLFPVFPSHMNHHDDTAKLELVLVPFIVESQ